MSFFRPAATTAEDETAEASAVSQASPRAADTDAASAMVADESFLAPLAPPPGASPASASDMSDDSLRMTAAAARRFARRRMRHLSATPDLVNSLIRPASPDTNYTSPPVAQAQPNMDILARGAAIANELRTRRSVTAALERRSGPMLPPHPSSLDIPKQYGGDCVLDMYALSYVVEPDANLLCPICHDPLVDPVTTPCDHTFCYRCLRRSISSSPTGTLCPIDRRLLSWSDCFSAARLVVTLLNSLTVRCPHAGRGCVRELRRDAVERHATHECAFREVPCPDPRCDRKIRGEAAAACNVCPHHDISCSRCKTVVSAADRDVHLLYCPRSRTRCQGCWQLIRRADMTMHCDFQCDGAIVACTYEDIGCPIRAMRSAMYAHIVNCPFHPDTPSGVVIRAQHDLIQTFGDLSNQLQHMESQQGEHSRLLRDLSASMQRRLDDRDAEALTESRTIRDLDAGFEEVHQNLTQLEARQSMWTLSQVMPIREEVTELRNNINMIRMHVNWLLNRSREEGRIRAANNTATPSPSVHHDSAGEPAPSMTERRRSSGAEAGVPRL